MARWRLPYFLAEPRSPAALFPLAGATDIAPAPFAAEDPVDRLAAHLAAVSVALDGDPAPRVLMGDCVAALPILAAQRRLGVDPAVVWFDAHGDFNTWATTPSGFIGGMPLAMCCGVLAPAPDRDGVGPDRRLLDAVGLPGDLDGRRVLLCDARDVDPGERELLAASGIARCRAEEVNAARIPDGPLYLHLDLDVVDPREVAGLLYPAPGGPGAGAVARAIETVMATGRVVAVGAALAWDLQQPIHSAQNAHLAPLLDACLLV
jgi:arginase